MRASPTEPAALSAGGAGGTAARRAAAQLRFALLVLGLAFALLGTLLIAYGLAAARVPQQRAALEELIRHQTGLEVRFSGLSVRWGWYGPEALFQDVDLGEPQGGGLRLRAPRLIVALDAWRIARSGHLDARHITLENPSIELGGDGQGAVRAVALAPADVRTALARVLARWPEGQINVSGGTLRTVLPGSTGAVTFGISRAQLRRLNAEWSAEAQVVLPQTLGASLHFSLHMRADPGLHEIPRATVSLEGRHLQLAAFAALAGSGLGREIPRSGSGDLEIQATFVRGHLRAASGRIAAQALEWAATDGAAPGLALERVRGNWQLTQAGRDWHLRVEGLELGSAESTPAATVVADIDADGMVARGKAEHAPLAPLVAFARWRAPQLPARARVRSGEAREVRFDWNAHLPPGARLAASAELRALALEDDSGAIVLSGLGAHVSATEASLAIALRAPAAELVLREVPTPLDHLELDAHVDATTTPAGGWQIATPALQIHGRGLSLTASAVIGSAAAGTPARIDTRVLVKESDVNWLAGLLGPRSLEALGVEADGMHSGRIESAELTWRGPLAGFPRGAPGTHIRAVIGRAQADGFELTDAVADWDGAAAHAAHFAGRVAGDAGQLLAWLRSHPQAAASAPGLGSLDLRGNTVLDLELTVTAVSNTGTQAAPPRVRVAALLDGVQLRPVPGLPPLEALRGTLAFAGGHVQRSTLTGRWLGGPASLTLGERREHGQTLLAVSGRGLMDAREALQAAGGDADAAGLSGSAEWSALLTVPPGTGSATRWQLHADSSLGGIASRLPEPFAKTAGTALPLHVDWEVLEDTARLHVALGERLAAVAALSRSADSWRIERGAVRLGGTAPSLPPEPVVVLDGSVSRLDVGACLALWREAASDAALPRLRAHLTATELAAGAHSFREVGLTAEAGGGAGWLRFQSSSLSGGARWPAILDAGHPALVHFSRFNITQPGDAGVATQIAWALAPAAQLAIDDLQWQGRTLGGFSGTLTLRGRALEASELRLAGASTETRGSAHCTNSGCDLAFSTDSTDAGAVLAAFGFAPQLEASHAHLEGQLRWSPQAASALATLGGSLHMRLEDGVMGGTGAGAGVSFPLLSVPALLAGMGPASGEPAQPALRFARFSADYELRDGEAVTPGLHFDGDAEILVRGRVGLDSGDYDEEAWILRGEDRLPAAVRRLGAGPRVAALWLSLRDLWGGDDAERARVGLRLRGPWSGPIVTPLD